jgi:hypothetical protein
MRQERLKKYEAVQARREAITSGFEKLESARQRDAALGQALQRYVQLQERQHAAEQRIEEARYELEGRRGLLEGWTQELQLKVATRGQLDRELLVAKDKVIELERWGLNLQGLREREDGVGEEVVRLMATNEG